MNIARIFKSFLTLISPKLNTRIIYRIKFKKSINLKNPKTIDEKIQWLKFNDYYKNELVKKCADKFAVREYIEQSGYPEILNPLIGVYDKVEDIPWDTLPTKFVLKWNYGSGMNIICANKSQLDKKTTISKLKKWYRQRKTFYLQYSELQYKDVTTKLICEKFIETDSGELPLDYKFYCFNGKAEYVMICYNRNSSEGSKVKYYFFNRNWKLQRINHDGKAASENFSIPKPEGIEKLFEYADKLSKPFPFVRADFYLEKGKPIFGELTFTPAGGFDNNRLPETQILMGDLLKLEV